jgi:predicted alpha/beta hydrolase family esterase
MKRQIVVIHGGDTFETHEEYLNFLNNYEIDIERFKTSKDDWKPWLRGQLGENYEVILPKMPNNFDARFSEWKLWLDKIVKLLNDEVILVGHSLGASFLVKYLSENKFSKKLLGVFLVGGVFDVDTEGYSLASFSLGDKLNLQTENAYFYHSKDDPVVPFSSMEKFMEVFPNAHFRVFENKGHLNQEEFPELVDDILSLG